MLRNNSRIYRYLRSLICIMSLGGWPTSYCLASSETDTDTTADTTEENLATTKTNAETNTNSVNASENAKDTLDNTPANAAIGYSDIITDEYFFSDLPVVFTATRLEQPVSETPVSMTIIDKEMIRASGALEIPELMRLVPGMQVANFGGDEYFVTYHGRADLYSRSLQVLVDGRSVYNPVTGGVAWSDLPLALEDIKRIEVIRGSNAASFGSNSFSGVINIITEDPSQQYGTLVKTTLGDKNTRQILARNAGKVGNLDYRVTINYDDKDGLKTRYDDASNKWLSFRGDYQFNSDNKLSFQSGYSKGTKQEGIIGSDWNIPRNSDSTTSFQQIKWIHTIDEDSEYSLHFFHNYKELNDSFVFRHPATGPIDLVTGFGYESDRYELEFQHLLKPTQDLRLAWGAGLRHDSTVSPDTLGNNSAAIRNQAHAFINAEWKPRDDITVNLGAMLEKYEGFSGLFSPRVALNYSLKENHIFRISHSRAYRMPNIWEEQIDLKFSTLVGGLPIYQLHQTVGVPKPEEINSIELGYMAAFKDIPLTMDVKIFNEKISPVINYAWDNTPNCPTCAINDGAGNFNNDGEVNINGLELQMDFKPSPNTDIHAVYSRLHAYGWQVSNYNSSGVPNNYIDVENIVPKETFGILASHRFDNGIQVSSGFYHTGKITWLEPGDETKSYNKWDFRVGKTFTLPDATIDVSAIMHNVTNDGYQEYYDINKADREFYLQLGIKF